MSIEIIIPDIGDGKFPIIEALVAVGDSVSAEDGIFVMESDKATMEVPAPADGVITALTVSVGDEVGTGDVIGSMTTEGGEATNTDSSDATAANPEPVAANSATEKSDSERTAANSSAEKAANTEVPASQPTTVVADEKAFREAHASPSIRKLARELGVDLGQVSGTGRKARITEDDVKQFVKSVLSGEKVIAGAAVSGGSGIPPVPEQDFSRFGSIEVQPLSKINVLTGQHMTRCWLNVPHVTQFDEADITDLELFRKSLKAEAEKLGVRVTMLSFLMKALVSGMKAFPKFNSSLSADAQSVIMKGYYHVGIAVDTPNGLVVPVISDVDQKSIYQLSEDLMTMSKKARDGKLTPTDMSGGCMTISSLGGIGGTNFTPIVNAPEVAILGVSRSKMQPVWNGSEFEPRNILPMSLSYDHRVIDGADGARFTQHLTAMLSDARRLLL